MMTQDRQQDRPRKESEMVRPRKPAVLRDYAEEILNPDETISTGQAKVQLSLATLETRRPLRQIDDPQQRERASQTRSWFHERCLRP